MSSGYIYIMYNPALREKLVKIGKMKRSSKGKSERTVRHTGVPENFIVAYDLLVDDCDLVEKVVHNELSEYRLNKKREFFRLSLKDASVKVQEVVERYRSLQPYPSMNKWVRGKENFSFDSLPESLYS